MLRMCSFCGDYGNKLIINEHSTFYFFMKNKGERQQETARLKFPKPSALQLCIVLSAVSVFLQNSLPPLVAVRSRAKVSGLNISRLSLRGVSPQLLQALWETSWTTWPLLRRHVSICVFVIRVCWPNGDLGHPHLGSIKCFVSQWPAFGKDSAL